MENADPDQDFWGYLKHLIKENGFEIDRPKGSAHPRFPDRIYPIDYGFIPGTTSSDGQGIDLFHGTAGNQQIDGILCTLDGMKKDSEIKVLYECTEEEIQTALRILSVPPMHRILVRRQDF